MATRWYHQPWKPAVPLLGCSEYAQEDGPFVSRRDPAVLPITFDAVICMSTLQIQPDPPWALDQLLLRLSRPGPGLLVLGCHNAYSTGGELTSRLRARGFTIGWTLGGADEGPESAWSAFPSLSSG